MNAITAHPDPKVLGAFYTPPTVADMMADWIVRTGRERLLEPSVGGAALIDACIAAATRKISAQSNGLRFLGCDIDPLAITKLSAEHRENVELRSVDFLQLDAASTGKFTGVIANPPFTRNHDLDFARRDTLRSKYKVSGAAGLWVHFLLHALEFVAPNGRMAVIVPGSALFTIYGRKVIERLAGKFARIEIRRFVDKPLWTNGAEERGALILCEGFGGSCVVPKISHWRSSGAPHTHAPISPTFETLNNMATPLGQIASLSIGVVTGCNPIFLLTDEERESYSIPKNDLRLVVTRVRQLTTLTINASKLTSLDRSRDRIWLMAPKSIDERHTGVRRRLAEITRGRRRTTHWFSKRSPWWKIDAGLTPDAIFTYMNDTGPRLVLVQGDLRCTNTLHAVRFKPGVQEGQKMAAALSSISTFGQLAAERIGRVYGGGMLKFELMDARQLPLLLAGAEVEKSFRAAVRAAADGNWLRARAIADATLICPLLGERWKEAVEEMTRELDQLRSLRRGEKA